MKKLIMLFGAMALIFSTLFVLTAVALASDADLLQPASTVTYNEDLNVNGTGRFNSVYIGSEGVGGVTFFNGTIVNVGEYVPVTFGDDVRIDGQIWGGPNKGNVSDQALKIADTLLPGLTNANDLGSDSLKWRNLYLAGVLYGNNVNLDGTLSATDLLYSGNLYGNHANLNGTLTMQPAGDSPKTRITLSNQLITQNQAENSAFKAQGLRFENYAEKYDMSFGKQVITNFGNSGQDIVLHGLQGMNDNQTNLLYMGLVKGYPDYDSVLWSADISGEDNARLGILANDIDIKARSIYMEDLKTMRFEGVDVKDNGDTKCEVKIEGEWKDVMPGTLLRGNDGINTKLRYCESNKWEDLYP